MRTRTGEHGGQRRPVARPSDELHEAIRADDPERLRAVLEAGVGVDVDRPRAGDDPTTALHAAIDAERDPGTRLALVRLLLDHGASTERRDHAGNGPLFLALAWDDLEVLDLLLQHGADPNAEVGYSGKSLVWWARSDYLHETYGHPLPERHDQSEVTDLDELIECLEDMARRHSKAPPHALRILRRYGARL